MFDSDDGLLFILRPGEQSKYIFGQYTKMGGGVVLKFLLLSCTHRSSENIKLKDIRKTMVSSDINLDFIPDYRIIFVLFRDPT